MLLRLSFVKDALPFFLHFLLVIISIIGVIWLIDPPGKNDHRVYNLNNRRPHFTDITGSQKVASQQNTKLLQSDITTILSLLASATRAAAAWWTGKLLWRCAFRFMEKSEITLAGFSKVISGGITTILSSRNVSTLKNCLLVYAIIIICFAMDYFSAILTGSVTWQPAVTMVDGVVPVMRITEGIPGSNISGYRSQPLLVSKVIEFAASLAIISWGVINGDVAHISIPSNVTRRAILEQMSGQSVKFLLPGSTLGNVRLPYFKAEKFNYITNPELTLTSQQLSLLNDTSPYNPYRLYTGYVALFPNTSWGPGSSLRLPAPVSVSESQILSILVEYPAVPSCTPPSTDLHTPPVPQNVNPYLASFANSSIYACFIFANVTYTAGATICRNCGIVSPLVVQGQINKLRPIPDPLTIEALSITSTVATDMYSHRLASVLFNNHTTLQGLAIETISRAYQSAWSSLVIELGNVGHDNQTNVMVAVPATHPSVVRWRVYSWAGLHIAVLLGGITFAYYQNHFRHPWVSNPVTAAFLLDTTGIFKQGEAADLDAMDPWHPDAKLPVGMLKMNDYDPSRPGKPRAVELMPIRGTSHSNHEQHDGESDRIMLLTQMG